MQCWGLGQLHALRESWRNCCPPVFQSSNGPLDLDRGTSCGASLVEAASWSRSRQEIEVNSSKVPYLHFCHKMHYEQYFTELRSHYFSVQFIFPLFVEKTFMFVNFCVSYFWIFSFEIYALSNCGFGLHRSLICHIL